MQTIYLVLQTSFLSIIAFNLFLQSTYKNYLCVHHNPPNLS